MKCEVSIGEAVDKLSILELKCKKITDPIQLAEIQKEIDALAEIQTYKTQLPFFYKLLVFINESIWTMTDTIKSMDPTSFLGYATLAHDIFEHNQKRFRLKHFFNRLLDSDIQEQKSYAVSSCFITIENEDVLFSKLSELFYLSISYDVLRIDADFEPILSKIIQIPSIQFIQSEPSLSVTEKETNIILADYAISKPLQTVFSLEPIRYITGGRFGDSIHSLSVMKEKYYETGRKGILFFSEKCGGDEFRFGMQQAYDDMFEMISQQNYIYSFSIYRPETDRGFDINLNDWRQSPYLFFDNWWFIYHGTYRISWGKHPWITLPTSISKDPKWENKVVVNTTSYRYSAYFNFQEIYQTYGDKLVFITMDPSHYVHFLQITGLSSVPCHVLTSFTELCVILGSCELLVAGLSGPLAVGFAMHTPCMIGMHETPHERTMLNNLNRFLPFIKYVC